MALQGSYEDAQGVTHASAYAKIVELTLDPVNSTARATVHVYHDSAAKTAGKTQVTSEYYTFEPSIYDSVFGIAALDALNANPQKNAYAELKNLDRFTGYTDV